MIHSSSFRPQINHEASRRLLSWVNSVQEQSDDSFLQYKILATRLGASLESHDETQDKPSNSVAFGFWVPEIASFQSEAVYLELLRPLQDIDLRQPQSQARFAQVYLPVEVIDDHIWVVVDGVQAGNRNQLGDLYQVRVRQTDGQWKIIRDPLANSLPWGAFSPAEIYDLASMHRHRQDQSYFQDRCAHISSHSDPLSDPPRFGPVANILQIHVGTATSAGTLASLTRRIKEIGARVQNHQALHPADQCFLGYDAIQLLPVEPTTVFEVGPAFFNPIDSSKDQNSDLLHSEVSVDLQRPCTTNWGYDIVIAGSATVNPCLLESGRPDELVDLAVALHTFPTGPIKLIFDVVFGHCDNQALDVLNPDFLAGPNMYGQNLRFRHPKVRAILLEMQRRKVNFGADGVRVDGAQDFKVWDPEKEVLFHDDDYLQEMSHVPQNICGTDYLPFFIFEDGRPWPDPDWELASTYLDIIKQQPHTFQWGPLTFAHNTPFLYTFWMNKWWRLQEILTQGQNWINGTANHDTVRRGTQVPLHLNINTRLGDSLLDILDHAYDHPAATLLLYLILPGTPMDFLQASMRVPWGFVRNADDRYGVKIAAEESLFLDWQVNDLRFNQPQHFKRLKARGFETLDQLKLFMRILRTSVEATEYQLSTVCTLISASSVHSLSSELNESMLKTICREYMDDVYEYCNVDSYREHLKPNQVKYNYLLRQARLARPWLRFNLQETDQVCRQTPANGSALFYGVRTSPDQSEQILFIANMEGRPVSISLAQITRTLEIEATGWSLLIASHSHHQEIQTFSVTQEWMISDSEALAFYRSC